jgi:hypothetical protein
LGGTQFVFGDLCLSPSFFQHFGTYAAGAALVRLSQLKDGQKLGEKGICFRQGKNGSQLELEEGNKSKMRDWLKGEEEMMDKLENAKRDVWKMTETELNEIPSHRG